MMKVHRAVTIRTRLDADEVRSRLRALAGEAEPQGWQRFTAPGFLTAGGVGERDFLFAYYFNSSKNAQTYSVHGLIDDAVEWRVLRLDVRSDEPWLHPLLALWMAFLAGLMVVTGELPPAAGAWLFAAVLTLYAVANLVLVPAVVTGRVANLLASAVRGAVHHGGERWVVPPAA